MKPDRKYITPFISLLFVVLAITGLLMLFHLFDGYTEVAHELIGIGFVIAAMFHIIINWNGLKSHFGKKVFLPAALAVLSLAAIFVYIERLQLPIGIVFTERITKAPLTDSFKVLEVDYQQASKRLQQHRIYIGNAGTIEEIWIANDADPEEVIELILESNN
jgi:uncharacterized protein DUF4405